MKIRFCGATTNVTGSCHMLITDRHKILLDCGQFQGGKEEEKKNWDPFPFDPKEIEAVVLSHAHIDHCGRLPLLVKRGFKGVIYCTDATADLLSVMLLDSAFIHEKDAEMQSKRNRREGKPDVEPLYTEKDANETLKLVKPILYDQLIAINDQMNIVFNDAGHILGSAITEIWVNEGDKSSKIVFSGDLGVINRPILRDPKKIKKADYIIMESTYGNRLHPENSTSIDELINITIDTVKRGGSVIIPSFAVGRTQELIFQFNMFYEHHPELQDVLSKVDVYIDSPMATTATEVFRDNASVFDEETKKYILEGDNPLDFKNLKFTRSTIDSQMLNELTTPKVIISASGMCEAGRIRHHLKHNLWDPKNSIVFVGYQAEGTLGRLLVSGAKEVKLFGEKIVVGAEIHNLEGFSGHADQNGLLDWLSGFEIKPKKVFLVHGEEDSKIDLAKEIQNRFGFTVNPLFSNTEIEIETGEVISQDEVIKEAIKIEDIDDLKEKVSDVSRDVQSILDNTNKAIDKNISAEKLLEINNIIKELEKATINLGSTVTKEDRKEN